MSEVDFKILDEIIDSNREILDSIKKLIDGAKNIAIIGHINPDGDCIGSQLGLGEGLREREKNIYNINRGAFETDYPKTFEHHFIDDTKTDIDLFIIVDTASDNRISYDTKKIDFSRTIVIDHHISNTKFGILNWIDDNYISTCEMIFILLVYMKISMNKDITQNLLNGLLADNGFFQHIRINKYLSLYISYLMIGFGADPKYSFDLMFCNNSISTEKVFALVLNRIETLCDGKILWTYIYNHDRDNYADFHSGMIFREMMSVRGVKVAIFFKINEEKGEVNASFRSTEDVDVASLAAEFGGGGHRVAAGVTIKGEYYHIKNMILDKVIKLF